MKICPSSIFGDAKKGRHTLTKMCRAEIKLPPFGTVVCTKSKGHTGDHRAYDATVDHQWTDEIDELADYRAGMP